MRYLELLMISVSSGLISQSVMHWLASRRIKEWVKREIEETHKPKHG